MLLIAKWILVFFGFFLILAGLLMLFAPKIARAILQKAGSTNLINYGELSLRMVPAAAFILYANQLPYPEFFIIFGWFMIGTSVILLLVPRRWHHQLATRMADILKPGYFQGVAPFSILAGGWLVYMILK